MNMTAININIFHYGQATYIFKSEFIIQTMFTSLDSHQQETECDGGKVRGKRQLFQLIIVKMS